MSRNERTSFPDTALLDDAYTLSSDLSEKKKRKRGLTRLSTMATGERKVKSKISVQNAEQKVALESGLTSSQMEQTLEIARKIFFKEADGWAQLIAEVILKRYKYHSVSLSDTSQFETSSHKIVNAIRCGSRLDAWTRLLVHFLHLKSSPSAYPYLLSQCETIQKEIVAVQAFKGKTDDDDGPLCVICLARPRTHLIIPCGHFAYCATCTQSLEECGICRMKSEGWVRVFVS